VLIRPLRPFAPSRPYRAQLAVVVTLFTVQAAGNLYLPRLNADLIDNGIALGDTRYILALGGRRADRFRCHGRSGGGLQHGPDPANPVRAATPFGDHSVIEFPGYRAPAWLTARHAVGSSVSFAVRAPRLRPDVPVTLWSPDGVPDRAPLPLLVLHDGPEFEQLTSVTRFSAVLIGAGRLPPHRVALVGPGDRNRWHAVSPAYGHGLTSGVLPALRARTAVTGPLALAGACLGALAALQAVTAAPTAFRALFLQSGSFFRIATDQQERSFARFGAVTSFVRWPGSGDRAGQRTAPVRHERREMTSPTRCRGRGTAGDSSPRSRQRVTCGNNVR
jgi:hypothetical protein